MYQIGDLIVCGDSGVCRVEVIGKLDVAWIDRNKLYYTLCPVYREGKIYVPIDTKILMRPVVTYEEVQQLIDKIPSIDQVDCCNESYKTTKEYYNHLLQTHDCTDLIKLIKTIYVKNSFTLQKGKQPGQIENKYMKQAEDLLYGEFAIALDIPKKSVKDYIVKRVEGKRVEELETLKLF